LELVVNLTKYQVNNIGISEHKIRPFLALIRGKTVSQAIRIVFGLRNREIQQKLQKVLLNIQIDSGRTGVDPIIKAISADQSTKLKRIMPRAQGRAFRIEKKSSTLSIFINS
jgi:large subunit ribosomal protein L22